MKGKKVIVSIPYWLYAAMMEHHEPVYAQSLGEAVRDGIPLPKGHGRLGDLDALREEVSSWGMNDYEPLDFIDAIDQADTIIEADKAEREVEE